VPLTRCLYPVYVRAEAYLSEQQGAAAAAEFRQFFDHHGLLWTCATGALAHIGLARAYALQVEPTKARAAYQLASCNSSLPPSKNVPTSVLLPKKVKHECVCWGWNKSIEMVGRCDCKVGCTA
jgi:hypothetical protein